MMCVECSHFSCKYRGGMRNEQEKFLDLILVKAIWLRSGHNLYPEMGIGYFLHHDYFRQKILLQIIISYRSLKSDRFLLTKYEENDLFWIVDARNFNVLLSKYYGCFSSDCYSRGKVFRG